MNETEKIIREKLIFYSSFREILVFTRKNKIGFPSVEITDDNSLNNFSKQLTGLNLDNDKKEKILTINSKIKNFNCVNRKLIPVYKDLTYNFYAQNIEFTDSILHEIEKRAEGQDFYSSPRLFTIEDLVYGSRQYMLEDDHRACKILRKMLNKKGY